MWCRLSAIAPLKSLDVDDKNTQHRQYWESCVGCRYIAVLFHYFLLVSTAVTVLLIEGPLQLNSTQLTTAKHNAIIPTPNPTTAQLAGGKRSHDGCQPGTLCGHRDLCSDTLVARLSSLSCLDVLLQDDFAFLDNIFSCTTVVRTAMPHFRPPARKPTHISSIEDESVSRACPAVLLCFFFYARRHTPTTINRPRARSSCIDFYIDSLLVFVWVNLISARSLWNK